MRVGSEAVGFFSAEQGFCKVRVDASQKQPGFMGVHWALLLRRLHAWLSALLFLP